MQKRLFLFVVIALLMISNGSIAKEIRVENAKAVFNIPDSYLVATRDNIPDSVIKRTGLTKQQIFDYLNANTTFILAYKDNHMIEITSVTSDNSRKVIDNLRVPEEQANDPKILDLIKKRMQDERHWIVNNVLSRRIANARFFVAEGNVTTQGGTLFIRYYTTIKNSVGLGVTGQSLIPNNSEMNTDLEYIVKNIKFDEENISTGGSQSNIQTSQPTIAKKNESSFLGKTIGKTILILVVAVIIQLWRYFKSKKK